MTEYQLMSRSLIEVVGGPKDGLRMTLDDATEFLSFPLRTKSGWDAAIYQRGCNDHRCKFWYVGIESDLKS